jgi:hypothetical protein
MTTKRECVTRWDWGSPDEAWDVCTGEVDYESCSESSGDVWRPICAPCLAVSRSMGVALKARSVVSA